MPQSQIQTLSLRTPVNGVARLIAAFLVVTTRRRERARLGQLDAHLLRDIGLNAREAQAECDKPFWRA